MLSLTSSTRFTTRILSGVAVLLLLIVTLQVFLNPEAQLVGMAINDITTDTVDPPEFRAVVALRPPGSHPVEYGGAAVAARQAELYPDIQPIRSALGAGEAFARALETARLMGWQIVADDDATGMIEAIDTTLLLRFKDDVDLRVLRTAEGSRVDIRSRSRVGRSDLGKNPARIREFIRRFSG